MFNVEQEIQKFKDCGHKVRVNHFRQYETGWRVFDDNTREPVYTLFSHKELRIMGENGVYESKRLSNHGGETVIQVTLEDGTQFEAVAKCNMKDNFSRKLGKQIAWGRFLVEYERYMGELVEEVQ